MSHANAPLSIEGRRRLVERCKTRGGSNQGLRTIGNRRLGGCLLKAGVQVGMSRRGGR